MSARSKNSRHECEVPNGHGKIGDHWACWCGKLWKLGPVCDNCERVNGDHHDGQCIVRTPWGETTKWRPAPFSLRIQHRLHGRKWRALHELNIPLHVRVRELEEDLARRIHGPTD